MAIKTEIQTDRKATGKKAIGNYGKIFGALVAVFVIALIIMSGPAQAFVLNLTSDKTSVTKGESVVFTVSVDVNSNENLPISKLVLDLSGPEHVVCEFNVDRTIISGCKGISIQKMIVENLKQGYGYGEYNGYGYNFGYGYGYDGNLEYKITLYTTDYLNGVYSTLLKAYIGNEVFSKDGNNLTISEASSDPSDNIGYYQNNNLGICLNDGWRCGEWSSCIDGKQTRICSPRINCYLGTKPEEQGVCVVVPKTNSSLTNYENLAGNLNLNGNSDNQNSNNGGDTNMETSGIMQNFLAGITGAVVGTPGENPWTLWVAVVFLAILVGLVLGLLLVRSMERVRKVRRIRELNRIRYMPPRQ